MIESIKTVKKGKIVELYAYILLFLIALLMIGLLFDIKIDRLFKF